MRNYGILNRVRRQRGPFVFAYNARGSGVLGENKRCRHSESCNTPGQRVWAALAHRPDKMTPPTTYQRQPDRITGLSCVEQPDSINAAAARLVHTPLENLAPRLKTHTKNSRELSWEDTIVMLKRDGDRGIPPARTSDPGSPTPPLPDCTTCLAFVLEG